MEPGVETYAIVSTIRVVLIKLKKDSNGLSPAFGWEVSLIDRGIVSSLLADHGHNGVALTITKRAEDRDISETFRDDRSRQSLQESTDERGFLKIKSIPSSAFSVDSGYSNDEAGAADVAAQENPHFNYSSTKKGGQVLEYFTVLAEFQHRVQLTALHNAICCVVGDYSAVIVDHADLDPFKAATTFGLFTFESSPISPTTSPASNADLISALEHLPWMHDTTFRMIRGAPRGQQSKQVQKLRQNWMYAKEVEASRSQGGPKWMVEARAKAMFVPPEPPILPESLDPYNPVVEKVRWINWPVWVLSYL